MSAFGKQLLAGVVSGVVSAAVVDIHAFQVSKTPLLDLKKFSWKTAVTRWAMGGVAGGMASLGLGPQ